MQVSRAEPVRASHEVELDDPAVLPPPDAPLRVPVLLPSPDMLLPDPLLVPDPVVEPVVDPVVLPLVEPVAEPLVLPAVEPLVVLSAASDAAEKASDTAAAIASIRCLIIIGTPLVKKMRDQCAREQEASNRHAVTQGTNQRGIMPAPRTHACKIYKRDGRGNMSRSVLSRLM